MSTPLFVKLFYGDNCKIGPGVARTAYRAGPKFGCQFCHLGPQYNDELDPGCKICYGCKPYKMSLPDFRNSRDRNLAAAQDGTEIQQMGYLPLGTLIRFFETGDAQSPDHIIQLAKTAHDRQLQLVGVFTKSFRGGDAYCNALMSMQSILGGPIMVTCATPEDFDIAKAIDAVPVVIIKKSEKEKFCKWPPPAMQPLSPYLDKIHIFPCPNQWEKHVNNHLHFYCANCRLCAPPRSQELLKLVKKFNYRFALGILEH